MTSVTWATPSLPITMSLTTRLSLVYLLVITISSIVSVAVINVLVMRIADPYRASAALRVRLTQTGLLILGCCLVMFFVYQIWPDMIDPRGRIDPDHALPTLVGAGVFVGVAFACGFEWHLWKLGLYGRRYLNR
jgi:hypothetical protein